MSHMASLCERTALLFRNCPFLHTYTSAALRVVRPSAGPPGAELSVIGDPTGVVRSDCTPSVTGGDSECLGDVRVRGWSG